MFDSVCCHESCWISVSPGSFRVRIVVVESATQQQCLSGSREVPLASRHSAGKVGVVLLSQVGPIFPLKFSHSNGTPVRPPSRPVCKAAKLMHKYQFCSFLSRKQGAYSYFEKPDPFSSLALSEPIPKTWILRSLFPLFVALLRYVCEVAEEDEVRMPKNANALSG